MGISFKGIGYTAIRAKDKIAMSEFYEKTLGLEKVSEQKDNSGDTFAITYKVGTEQCIKLLFGTSEVKEYTSNNEKCNRSHFHLCFETDNRHSVIECLESRGLHVGTTEDDTVGLCKSYCQFVTDPEGNEWEIMEFTSESMQLQCKPEEA